MLRFRPIDPNSESDVAALASWANDSEIRHLFQVLAQETQEAVSADLVKRQVVKALAKGKLIHLLVDEDEVLGEVSCEIDPPQLHRHQPHSAWFGLVIGASHARGRGLGRQAMLHIEAQARALGATRAEIGVFDFNRPARALYAKMGYKEFARIENFTWWKGERWTDIRMEKRL